MYVRAWCGDDHGGGSGGDSGGGVGGGREVSPICCRQADSVGGRLP